MLGVISDLFWPIQATFVIGEPLCDMGTANSGRICGRGPLCDVRTRSLSANNSIYLESFNEKSSVWLPM